MLNKFEEHQAPFRHFHCPDLIPTFLVDLINEEWPKQDDPRWLHEVGPRTRKSAILFPRPLPAAAQMAAEHFYTRNACEALSLLLGFEVLPDPWFKQAGIGGELGGGLHEIHPGGFLKTHVDFEEHPSGLTRTANLLIYLNRTWEPAWDGALELGLPASKSIEPLGGSAVLFATTRESWHGHPRPLACPESVSRRSLALYYYSNRPTSSTGKKRPTTIYADKIPPGFR